MSMSCSRRENNLIIDIQCIVKDLDWFIEMVTKFGSALIAKLLLLYCKGTTDIGLLTREDGHIGTFLFTDIVK